MEDDVPWLKMNGVSPTVQECRQRERARMVGIAREVSFYAWEHGQFQDLLFSRVDHIESEAHAAGVHRNLSEALQGDASTVLVPYCTEAQFLLNLYQNFRFRAVVNFATADSRKWTYLVHSKHATIVFSANKDEP